jgi:hypothetical protein
VIRSKVDYILVEGHQPLLRHQVWTVPYANTNHRMVYVDFKPGDQRVHQRYLKKMQTFPVELPSGEDMTQTDKLFQVCLDSQPPRTRQPAMTACPS